MKDERSLTFFLGGRDLEMVAIRELLERTGAPFFDWALDWGAKASAYEREIGRSLERSETPVLVELEDDLGLAEEAVIIVDHHGERAGRDEPTSIEQVFELLELLEEQWTRQLELVAANDRGGVQGLVEAGATSEEIAAIRAEDRRAQGVTVREEREAAAAAEELEERAGGRLTVARLPHRRTAPLVDRLEPALDGPGFENLLVISPGEVNFYGSGELVRVLEERFPGGWSGGELPERGFWGRRGEGEEVVEVLEEKVEGSRAEA